MKKFSLLASLLWVVVCLSPAISRADDGSCDVSIERTKKTLLYKSGTLVEDGEKVKVKPTCEFREKVIKKCSVVSTQSKRLQKYCYPEDGTPEYYEIYDVIEYFEAKEQ